LTGPLDGPPKQKVIGTQIDEFIEGAVIGVLHHTARLEAQPCGGNYFAVVARQETPMIVAKMMDLLDGGETEIMDDLLTFGSSPARINLPIGCQVFTRIGLSNFDPMLESGPNIALPVFMKLFVDSVASQFKVKDDISFQFAPKKPLLLETLKGYPVPSENRDQLFVSSLLEKTLG
jgi:hypothetical protein